MTVPATRPATGPFAALRSRNFRLFLGGQLLSNVGTWVQSVAHGWLVLQLTDSAFVVGLVAMLGSLPILLFTLYGGVIADRVNKRRVVFWLQAGMLVEALVLGVLTSTGHVTVPVVMALAFVFGTLSAFEVPTRQALFADLVPRADLSNAIALNSAAYNVARVVGPALAGLLIGTAGLAECFYVNALSFVAVLWGLARIEVPPAATRPPAGRVLESFREGLRYLVASPWPRTLMLMTTSLTVFSYAFLTMLAVFAKSALGLGAQGYGVISAAVGLGAAVAALAIAAAGTRLRFGRLAAWAATGFGVTLIATAVAPTVYVAAPLLMVAGMLLATAGVATNTFLQQLVPDGLRGRVMGFYSFVVLGLMPFGSLQSGFVAEHLGVRACFALCGAAALVTGLVVVLRRRGGPGW